MTVFSKRNQPADGPLIYELPPPLRMQVTHIWDELVWKITDVGFSRDSDVFYNFAHHAVCHEFGTSSLTRFGGTRREDLLGFFLDDADTSQCLDIIEIVFNCVGQFVRRDHTAINFHLPEETRIAAEKLNQRFLEHRVGFEFRDGHFIKVDSKFLHSEAVAPALELLREPYLKGANDEFSKAQNDFRHGRYSDCVNECLKAFESAMKCICDKRGWQYNQNDTARPLLGICQRNNLFPPFMADSLNNLLGVLINVATVRNKLSGHGKGVQDVEVDKDTASFALNSAASNILFLASCEKKLS